MVRLSLYHNISPNNNYRFYLHNGNFKTYLRQYLAREINADNYRVNTNVIKLASVGAYEYDIITYICEEVLIDNVVKYTRYYHVNSVSYVSGYALFNIDIDLWATYIAQAYISKIHVTRCNRLIDTPIFDNIKATKDKPILLSVDSNGAYNGIATPTYLDMYMNIDRYYLVMAVNYNAKQNITGENTASTTSLFGIRLSTLRNEYIKEIENTKPKREDYETEEEWQEAVTQWENNLSSEEYELYFNKSAVEMARDFAGGVFGIASNGFSKNDARVVSAYIIDSTFISTSGWATNLSSVSIYKKGEKTIESQFLETKQYTDSLYIRNISLNYKIFAGLNYGGLQLNRIVNENYAKVYIRVTLNVSSVEIQLMQGDNEEDITSAFELTITNNVTQTTMLRSIAKAIGRTGSTTRSVMKGAESGGVTGAIGGGLTSLASMVGDYSLNNQVRGHGDATITFGGYGQYVLVPYKACAYISIDNEEENARNRGATFSKFIPSLGDLLTNVNYTLLGSGNNNDTFVSATCLIDGIPSEASNYIKNTLAGGVYLVDARI